MKTQAERIKARREELGWDQIELSEIAHISQPTIANLESGKIARSKLIPELARALKTSVEWLVWGTGDHLNKSPIDDLPDLFQDAIRIQIDRYRELAAKMPSSVLHILQRPTAENFTEWERAMEESYRTYIHGAPNKPDAVEKHATIRIEGGKKKKNTNIL